MSKVSDLHRGWMKHKEYRDAFAELAPELAPEFARARAIIGARVKGRSGQEDGASARVRSYSLSREKK